MAVSVTGPRAVNEAQSYRVIRRVLGCSKGALQKNVKKIYRQTRYIKDRKTRVIIIADSMEIVETLLYPC